MSQGTPPALSDPSEPDAPPPAGWARRRSPAPAPESANELAQERTDLATDRTLMAADRSCMAWSRTALSSISFGFTIYKVLQGLEATGRVLGHPNTPRTVGLFLTTMGTGAMVRHDRVLDSSPVAAQLPRLSAVAAFVRDRPADVRRRRPALLRHHFRAPMTRNRDRFEHLAAT